MWVRLRLVDELGVPVSNEQKRIAVEPGHGALEANAAGQKDRDRHIVLAHMLQEGVLESVRMRCSHDRSPWTPHTCWPTVPLSAQRPTPEHHSARVPCRRTEPRLGSGYLGLSGSAALPLRTGLLGQSFAPALGCPTCGPIHPTRTDLARMTALLG